MASNQQLTSNQSQQLAFRPSSTSFAPQALNRANAANFYAANPSAVNVNRYTPASASRPPAPIFKPQPQNVNTYMPVNASLPPVPRFDARPHNVNTYIPASASFPPVPRFEAHPRIAYNPANASLPPVPRFEAHSHNGNTPIPASASFPLVPSFQAQPQLSLNEVNHSHNTQHFQDDGRRDDVQNLLVLSEVDIPPNQRKHTPKQMSCDLTEHQRIGLTWLLEQEKDRKKKGGLLAGLSHISSQLY